MMVITCTCIRIPYLSRSRMITSMESALAKLDSRVNNFVLSIDAKDHFDVTGNLNSDGKEVFWEEINACMQKFELNKINLKPKLKEKTRKQQRETTRSLSPSTYSFSSRAKSPQKSHSYH